MRRSKLASALLVALWLSLSVAHGISADVSPGDAIDKTNWEKLEGLVPDSVLNWVKKGHFVVGFDELKFQPRDYFPPFAREAFDGNAGKYDLDEQEGIIDVETGKPPEQILGLPFPEVGPEEPKAPQKIMYNALYMQYLLGNLRFSFQCLYMGRSRFERELNCVWQQVAMDGYPGAQGVVNPDGIEKYTILLVKGPFDLKGTAVMLWRYLHPKKQDRTVAFVPAIRRVR